MHVLVPAVRALLVLIALRLTTRRYAVRATFGRLSWKLASLKVGESVAGVELKKQLAVGGGAEIWAAKGDDGRQAVVAALTKGAAKDARDYFLVEANTWTERWESRRVPGILKVLDVDPIAGAYVGDHAPVATVADVSQQDLQQHAKLVLFRDIVDIVAALHKKGIVHGWLRPENVLLDHKGKPTIVNAKLLDVATSCRVSPAAVKEHQAYTAPEVRMGSAADASSDVYALGRIFHFVLTGETPDEKDERLPRLDALKNEHPMLMRVIRYCVLMDRTERYQDAGELAQDLTRFGEGEMVGMPHPDFDGKEQPPSSRRLASLAPKKGADLKYKKDAVATLDVPTGKRATGKWNRKHSIGFGVLGVVLLAAGVGGAMATGEDNTVFQVLTWLAAFPLGMIVPGGGRQRMLLRGLAGAIILGVIVFVEPTALVEGNATSGIHSPNLAERVAALRAMRKEGKTQFQSIDLSNANLAGLDMVKAEIDGGKLRSCNCVGVDFTDASSWNVDMTGADFSGAKLRGLDPNTVTGWDTVKCDSGTIMPTSWKCVDGRAARIEKKKSEGGENK